MKNFMAMYPCKNCKKNNWQYRFNDESRMVTATCNNCGDFVSFPAKRKQYERTGIFKSKWGEIRTINGYPELRNDTEPVWRRVELAEGFKKGRKFLHLKTI